MYAKHHIDVCTWFKDRPADMLVLNVCKGDGWDKLCQFLNLPVPSKEFPKTNASNEAWKTLQELF